MAAAVPSGGAAGAAGRDTPAIPSSPPATKPSARVLSAPGEDDVCSGSGAPDEATSQKPTEDEPAATDATTGSIVPHGFVARLSTISSSFACDSQTTERKDSIPWLSAAKSDGQAPPEGHDADHHEATLPLLLIAFVCILAVMSGFVVVGVHTAVIYSGCPLGINGCNEFHHKEDKGFLLVHAVQRLESRVPEEVVYVVCAALGCAFCGLLQAILPRHLAAQIRGGGTVQSLVAVAKGEKIPLAAAVLRVVVSCVFVGTGGTLGMEGPAIQVCTAIATLVGWSVGIRSVATQSLLASLGFSCGFAASFNAPIAGILFAMEELQHVSPRLSQSIICIILVASVVSTTVVRACHGNVHLFDTKWGQRIVDEVSGGSLDDVLGEHMWMLIAVPIGILCSVTCCCIVRGMRCLHSMLKAWCRPGLPAAGAMVVQALLSATIGAVVFRVTGLRGIWGVGAESLQWAFDRDFHAAEFLLFAAGKLLATVLAVAVRAPGDVLEPVLIGGGFLGGTVGSLLVSLGLGDRVMQPCVIFGMAGLFASCFRFPLTPVVLVLELTGVDTYAIVLPTVLASFTGNIVSNRLCRAVLDELMWEDDIDLAAISRSSRDTETGDPDHDENDPQSQAPMPDTYDASEQPGLPLANRPPSRTNSSASGLSMDLIFSKIEESLLEQSGRPSGRKRGSSGDRWDEHHDRRRASVGSATSSAPDRRRPSTSSGGSLSCTGWRRFSREISPELAHAPPGKSKLQSTPVEEVPMQPSPSPECNFFAKDTCFYI